METGTVKFFDSRDSKRFGFIRKESGEEVFFHFNDGQCIVPGNFEPRFEEGRVEREPRKGDVIVFNQQPARKGNKACPWGYANDYEQAKRDCRPVHDAAVLQAYPFLFELLREANPYDNGNTFSVTSAEMAPELLRRKGMHRFRTGENTTFYAVVKNDDGKYGIHALRSESWWPDGIEEGYTEAHTIGEQLTEKGIALENLVAIVEVDTGEAKSYLANFNTQAYLEEQRRPRRVRRIATVFCR